MTKETESKILQKLTEISGDVKYTNGKVARAIKDIEDNKKEIKYVREESEKKIKEVRGITDGLVNKMYLCIGALGVIALFADKIIALITG